MGCPGGTHSVFTGAFLRREICVLKSILKLEVNLPFLLCFTLSLRAIFQLKAPGGITMYIWRGDLTEGFFYVTGLWGLIRGGAYFRNFTVFKRCSKLPVSLCLAIKFVYNFFSKDLTLFTFFASGQFVPVSNSSTLKF